MSQNINYIIYKFNKNKKTATKKVKNKKVYIEKY